jgi:uncharacterized phage-associated protein
MIPRTTKILKAQDIGRYFIHLANQEKRLITNKKLQKLVYYSQAWSLVLSGKRLFSEPIEAWVHGPAVRSLYVHYKHFGFSPIAEKVTDADVKNISGKIKTLLDEVWSVYGKFDAQYLEMLTHSEKPWQIARAGMQNHENSTKEISSKSMKAFYSEKLASATKKQK